MDRAADDDFKDVVVPVEVDALTVEAAVFVIAEGRIAQLVGGIESLATADAHLVGSSHARTGRNVLRRSKSATFWRAPRKASACPALANSSSALSPPSSGRTPPPNP